MSRNPDHRGNHHQLYTGYGLIVAVLVLMALSINSYVDRGQLHRKTVDLDDRVAALSDRYSETRDQLQTQTRENATQDETLKRQHERLQRQEQIIAKLARLRMLDSHALTALHDELAARYAHDVQVKRRLDQLEANNSAARTVIISKEHP